MQRRAFIGSAFATGALLKGRALFAQTRPLRVLVLGGTGFIGPHFVTALRASGHKLTLFNRGRRAAALPADIETLKGDRNGQIDALRNRQWDAVIDNSGYTPREVQLTVDALAKNVPHYIFVSSISAYRDLKAPGIDEDYPLAQLKDASTQEVTNESYGGLKVLCEQIVERAYSARATIIRPTYIVGPGDTSDRFTYWPVRVARGGQMLAPGTQRDPMQFIDVRDLAEFMRLVVEQQIAGRYNTANPPGAVTVGAVLDTSKRIANTATRFVWADAKFLAAEGLVDSNELPIWSPPEGELAGAALVSSARAVAKGLRFRDLEETVRDTLKWHRGRPADQQKLRAGLTAEREAELLKSLQKGTA